MKSARSTSFDEEAPLELLPHPKPSEKPAAKATLLEGRQAHPMRLRGMADFFNAPQRDTPFTSSVSETRK